MKFASRKMTPGFFRPTWHARVPSAFPWVTRLGVVGNDSGEGAGREERRPGALELQPAVRREARARGEVRAHIEPPAALEDRARVGQAAALRKIRNERQWLATGNIRIVGRAAVRRKKQVAARAVEVGQEPVSKRIDLVVVDLPQFLNPVIPHVPEFDHRAFYFVLHAYTPLLDIGRAQVWIR